MNTLVKKFEPPVQFWSMLGPLFIAFILWVMMIQGASPHFGLPIIAIGGLLLCSKWSWQGCYGALFALAAFTGYQLFFVPSVGNLWTIILALSIGFSFIITLLLQDEAVVALDLIKEQSDRSKETLLNLEEKLAAAKQKLEIEKQILGSRLEPLKREVAEKSLKCEAQEKLVILVREELLEIHADKENLLKELHAARQQSGIFEQEVARLQDRLAEDPLRSNDSVLIDLKETVSVQRNEIIELKSRLDASLEEESLARSQSEKYVTELIELREINQKQEMSSDKIQEEQMLHKLVSDELNAQIEILTREKQFLEMTLSGLQGEFEALMLRDKTKEEMIDLQNAEVDDLKSAAEQAKDELRAEKDNIEALKISFENRERGFHQQIDELMKKLSNTTSQLSEWQRKYHDYNALNDRYASLQMQVQEHISNKDRLLKTLEQSRRRLEEVEQHLNTSASREVELRVELDDMTRLYNEAHSKTLSNENLSFVADQLRRECSDFEKAILRDKELYLAKESELNSNIESLNDQLKDAASELDRYHHLELENQSLRKRQSEESQLSEGSQLKDAKPNEIDHSFESTSCVDERVNYRDFRRIEGLYLQLRDQFAQKTKVLDETRRELFVQQEKYASIQKELEETTVYGESEVEKTLYHLLAKTESLLTNQENDYDDEQRRLHGLIETLTLHLVEKS